jgi:hypothetical protein
MALTVVYHKVRTERAEIEEAFEESHLALLTFWEMLRYTTRKAFVVRAVQAASPSDLGRKLTVGGGVVRVGVAGGLADPAKFGRQRTDLPLGSHWPTLHGMTGRTSVPCVPTT